MKQKRPYPQKPSGRTHPKHSPSGKTFLIVTEGKKTEPNYFEKLREHLRLTALKIDFNLILESSMFTERLTRA
jgi:hypothetical protein